MFRPNLFVGTGVLVVIAATTALSTVSLDEGQSAASASATNPTTTVTALLRPTAHPALPPRADLWLVPAAAAAATVSRPAAAPSPALKALADGIESIAIEDFATALPKVSAPALARTTVAEYAAYYAAFARLRTGQPDAARETFRQINAKSPDGVLKEWALLGEAEAAEAQQDYAAAARLYESASKLTVAALDEVLTAVARTKLAAGQRDAAMELFRRIYFLFPLSPLAEPARQQILAIAGIDEVTRVKQDATRELGRAQRLFGSKRYADALSAFQALDSAGLLSGDEQELAHLRIAESQYYLGRYREALDGARPFTSRASRKTEARFFSLSAQRGVGDHAGYVTEARRLVEDFPDSPWAEETLNNLGTHYILTNDDAAAGEVFREYLDRFPTGRYAQRAAWKYGWARYRQQDYQTAIAVFERAATNFPRADYRPPYLYWSARAYDHLKQPDAANLRYSLLIVDYLNSYYGRLADDQMKARGIPKSQRATLITRSLSGASRAASRTAAPPPAAATTAGAPATPGDGTNASDGAQPAPATANATSPTAATAAASAGPVAKPARAAGQSADPAAGGETPATSTPATPAASTTSTAPATVAGTDAPPADAAAAKMLDGPPPNDARIRRLIVAGLYRTALAEVDYARRTWGSSIQIDATAAWLYRELGDIRRGINTMKRAYPQYLTADADQLPASVRRVIFPVEYWSSIRRQAAARGLDPYLVAALIAQESNFQPDARSSANAYGLMQILPTTGRQLARRVGIRRFSTAQLTNADINLRLGTLHFQQVLRQFGGRTYYALASYNAGESKVARWIAERGELSQDEFIDDIPYPETQNYVKRILGTAEDYRRLYD